MDIWRIIVEKHGVVSLLDMLEFAAKDFAEISYTFGIILGESNKLFSQDPNVLGNALGQLLVHASHLGLDVTTQHLISLIGEMCKENPENLKHFQGTNKMVFTAPIDTARMLYHIESLHSTMLAELGSSVFKAVPKERKAYCDPKWLAETEIPTKFPTSLTEFQRAGNCYAFGQPTACVFHSMRALEPCLNALAGYFGVSFSQENWQKVIQEIETKVRCLGNQAKSQKKLEDEKFFGGATAELYFVKNAWRNHVAHTRDSYGDDEAFRVMQHAVQFVESLCPRLGEPSVL
jgi:hypothetical protein